MANVLQMNLCEYPGAANYNHVIDLKYLYMCNLNLRISTLFIDGK